MLNATNTTAFMAVFSPASRGENVLPLHGNFQSQLKFCLAPMIDKSECVIDFSAWTEKFLPLLGGLSHKTMGTEMLTNGLTFHRRQHKVR